METIGGFTRPPAPVGPDLVAHLAAATGLDITDATVDQTQAYVTGEITPKDFDVLQAAMDAYIYTPPLTEDEAFANRILEVVKSTPLMTDIIKAVAADTPLPDPVKGADAATAEFARTEEDPRSPKEGSNR